MKLSVGKRILMFFHWLMSLLICVAFALYLIVPSFVMQYYGKLEAALELKYIHIIGIALLVIYAALAIVQIYLIFKRRRRADRGFITVDSSDTGKVRIAISAIEAMVRQSVTNIDGITEMKIGIESREDAIAIRVNATIVNGSHVPTITMNMQRAIRQFVEMNCGVAVREVSISINAVTNVQEAGHRRRMGRGKAEAAPQSAAPAVPVVDDYQAPAVEPQSYEPEPQPYAPAAEPVSADYAPVTPEPEPAAQPAEPVQPAFDFDKPYESEFAKDLAAMKAAEAGESAEARYDAEGEPEDANEAL